MMEYDNIPINDENGSSNVNTIYGQNCMQDVNFFFILVVIMDSFCKSFINTSSSILFYDWCTIVCKLMEFLSPVMQLWLDIVVFQKERNLSLTNFWIPYWFFREEHKGGFRKEYHIIFVPRKSLLCEKKLKVNLVKIYKGEQSEHQFYQIFMKKDEMAAI